MTKPNLLPSNDLIRQLLVITPVEEIKLMRSKWKENNGHYQYTSPHIMDTIFQLISLATFSSKKGVNMKTSCPKATLHGPATLVHTHAHARNFPKCLSYKN